VIFYLFNYYIDDEPEQTDVFQNAQSLACDKATPVANHGLNPLSQSHPRTGTPGDTTTTSNPNPN